MDSEIINELQILYPKAWDWYINKQGSPPEEELAHLITFLINMNTLIANDYD